MLKSLFEQIINMFKDHPKRVIFILFFTITITLFCAFFAFLQIKYDFDFVHTVTSEEEQQIFIFKISLNNWCTILTIIGVFFTAIWAIHEYDKKNKLSQQEKASEIAQNFANNLIERMGLISEVLMPNQEIQKIIKIIDNTNINQFTLFEVQNIFDDQNYVDKFCEILLSKNTQKRYNKILNRFYSPKERERFDSKFAILVDNTLNQLEAICINISSKAAGSQFIYESLHQMFLSTVEILYLRISASNNNNVDKYYTNIISVYNMWNIQKNKDIKKLDNINKKIQKNQEKMKKEIKMLLDKQTKTV